MGLGEVGGAIIAEYTMVGMNGAANAFSVYGWMAELKEGGEVGGDGACERRPGGESLVGGEWIGENADTTPFVSLRLGITGSSTLESGFSPV